MKRGSLDHPKMIHLARLLNQDLYCANGLVERLLHWASKYAPQGNIGKFSDADIELGLTYSKPGRKLGKAIANLIESGWLDPVEGPDRLVIHDIQDHADDAWRKSLERQGLTFWDGTPARETTARQRRDNGEKNLDNGETTARQRREKVPLPVPEPVPVPEPSRVARARTRGTPPKQPTPRGVTDSTATQQHSAGSRTSTTQLHSTASTTQPPAPAPYTQSDVHTVSAAAASTDSTTTAATPPDQATPPDDAIGALLDTLPADSPLRASLAKLRHTASATATQGAAPASETTTPPAKPAAPPDQPARHYPPAVKQFVVRVYGVTKERAWVDWWYEVVNTSFKAGCLGEVDGLIKYVEDCQNPATRAAKDLGDLPPSQAGKWLVAKTTALLKASGCKWPDFPVVAGAGNSKESAA